MKNILLLYGHTLSHTVLKKLISSTSGLKLVDEAKDVIEAMQKVSVHKIDVLVLDISSSQKNGLETFCDIKYALPKLKILIVNGSNQIDNIRNFVWLGCEGYLPFNAPSNQLNTAIEALCKGLTYILPENKNFEEKQHSIRHKGLTVREMQVFCKLIKGQAINLVAKELSLTPGSVSVYKCKIMKKMNIFNNASLIQYAINHQLIDTVF